MIYLASPYSAAPHHNTRRAAQAAVYLFRLGHNVFSPVLHWHHAAQWAALPTDAQFWWDYNLHMLRRSDGMCVLQIEGWDRSSGVRMEMDWWRAERGTEGLTFLLPAEVERHYG